MKGKSVYATRIPTITLTFPNPSQEKHNMALPNQKKEHSFIKRSMLPLVLAYALTIHKSQSITLNQLVVHLGTENPGGLPGMAYTALSRVKTLEGIMLTSMDQRAFKSCPQVHTEYARLRRLIPAGTKDNLDASGQVLTRLQT